MEELGGLEDSDDELLKARGEDILDEEEEEEAPVEEAPKFYNEAFKAELAAYREMKNQEINKKPTV